MVHFKTSAGCVYDSQMHSIGFEWLFFFFIETNWKKTSLSHTNFYNKYCLHTKEWNTLKRIRIKKIEREKIKYILMQISWFKTQPIFFLLCAFSLQHSRRCVTCSKSNIARIHAHCIALKRTGKSGSAAS